MPTPNRHSVRLSAVAERHVRRGHPWIYDQGIEKGPVDGKAGDLAIIFGRKSNKLVGIGLWDPHSPIRIKMLHQGKGVQIDETWFAQKIETAYQKRLPLLASQTNGYRLIFGENDGLPGLIADVYAHCLVIKIYSAVWFAYFDWIVPLLEARAGTTITVLRFARRVQALTDIAEGTVLTGAIGETESVIFEEYGVRFHAYPVRGHKTGFFLDHRHNRREIGQRSAGKSVLDVFSYAGGFSVHALAGGARSVISLDISRPALAAAQQNAALNSHVGSYETVCADAFDQLKGWAKAGKKFDLVIIDPPALAKKQSEVELALRKYAQLANLGARLTDRRGLLMLASCSSRVDTETFFRINRESLPDNFRLIENTAHDVDHPVGFPEGAYLKTGYYQHY